MARDAHGTSLAEDAPLKRGLRPGGHLRYSGGCYCVNGVVFFAGI